MTRPKPTSELSRARPKTSSAYAEKAPGAISERAAAALRSELPPISPAEGRAIEGRRRTMEAVLAAEPKVSVRIAARGSDGDVHPVFVGINGVNLRLQRGVQLDVPLSVAELLRTAEYI